MPLGLKVIYMTDIKSEFKKAIKELENEQIEKSKRKAQWLGFWMWGLFLLVSIIWLATTIGDYLPAGNMTFSGWFTGTLYIVIAAMWGWCFAKLDSLK